MTGIGDVFDETAKEFSELSPHLWDPIGTATVETARFRPGERVLDVCCGTGASAIPAARAVGPAGQVDAIDLAGKLIGLGRAKATTEGLGNVRFTQADALLWTGIESRPYDVIQCVHGVFFLPDMDTAVARLITILRPGGRLVVTTWAKGAVEDLGRLFSEAVATERETTPEPPKTRHPVTRIDTEKKLAGWLSALGLNKVSVTRVPLALALNETMAWKIVLGSGFRAMLRELDTEAVQRVRRVLARLLDERGPSSLDCTSLVGVGARDE
ncbi:hypothetical protein Aple_009890 [Acrocarpospora pleiomorpha]|uniref:Methyltransferase domain-containing protein n=1 Tax=Acrocarpospora pleiomorpha TaxID=90975 RepID=A0A5M3XAD4_9ACTN|nr:class I SAM-dependent methyltransferase [Acrocarpospora pleiomorpha]GES18094.1 hypothetical protein Aple_009890 [Acrocarpospora pleiomorpha]